MVVNDTTPTTKLSAGPNSGAVIGAARSVDRRPNLHEKIHPKDGLEASVLRQLCTQLAVNVLMLRSEWGAC